MLVLKSIHVSNNNKKGSCVDSERMCSIKQMTNWSELIKFPVQNLLLSSHFHRNMFPRAQRVQLARVHSNSAISLATMTSAKKCSFKAYFIGLGFFSLSPPSCFSHGVGDHFQILQLSNADREYYIKLGKLTCFGNNHYTSLSKVISAPKCQTIK